MARARNRQTVSSNKPLFGRWWFWVLVVAAIIGVFKNGGQSTTGTSNPGEPMTVSQTTADAASSSATEASTAQNVSYEYDALKRMFQKLTFDTTISEVEQLIAESGLPSTKEDHNGYVKYCVAYKKGAALQKYAVSGDQLGISFSRPGGTFMYADYLDKSAFAQAIIFSYGSYFSLYAKEPNSEKSGYYFQIPGKDYEKVQSSEEALNRICQRDPEK